jgi:putative glutamine amidotransferase
MPLIAITPCNALHDYEESVRRAGGDVRILNAQDDQPADVIDAVHGLLLTGGRDVDPALYGEPPHATYAAAEPGRDRYELDLLRRAFAAGMPVFAICRGIQVLNVALGGTLVQDVATQLQSTLNHSVREPSSAIAHDIWINPGSVIERLMREHLNDDTCAVNSRHHQAIRTLGDGLVVSATAPDGVIEAVEDPGRVFCLGVQWHPENFHRTGEFRPMFEGFVQAAQPRS